MKSKKQEQETVTAVDRKIPVRGFTLTELMVVVAVLAVLAALILPGLARAKTKANSIVCVANLKTIGTAFEMFAATKDEFPLFVNPPRQQNLWVRGGSGNLPRL